MQISITATFTDEQEAFAWFQRATCSTNAATVAQPAPPAPAPKAPAAPKTKAEKPAAPAVAPTPPALAAIEYPVLRAAVFELAAKDAKRVEALIAEQGGRTFKELTPDEYPAALERVKAAMAEVNAEVA